MPPITQPPAAYPSPPPNGNSYVKPLRPKTSTTVTVLAVIGGLIVVGILVAIVVIFSFKFIDNVTKPAAIAAENYISAMSHHNDAASIQLESSSLKRSFNQQQLDSEWSDLGISHYAYTIGNRNYTENNGVQTVLLDVNFKTPKNPKSIEINLQEYSGQWLVTGISY